MRFFLFNLFQHGHVDDEYLESVDVCVSSANVYDDACAARQQARLVSGYIGDGRREYVHGSGLIAYVSVHGHGLH